MTTAAMLNTNCLKCGSDQTQSFSMAYKSGTGMAKMTRPPKKESGVGENVAWIFIAVVIFNFVGSAFSLFFVWISGRELGNLFAWFAGMSVGFIAAIGFGIWVWKRTSGQQNKNEAAHKAALMKWEHSWICLRCGSTYYVR